MNTMMETPPCQLSYDIQEYHFHKKQGGWVGGGVSQNVGGTLCSLNWAVSISGSVLIGSAVLISFSARSRYFNRSSISRRACKSWSVRHCSTASLATAIVVTLSRCVIISITVFTHLLSVIFSIRLFRFR